MDQGSTGSSTITQLTTSSVAAFEQDPAYLSDASIDGAGYISDDDDEEEEVPVYEPQEDPEEEEDPSEDEDPEELPEAVPEEEDDPSEDEDPVEVGEDLRDADPPVRDHRAIHPPGLSDGPARWIDRLVRDGKRPMLEHVGPIALPPDAIIRPSDGSGPSHVMVMDDEGRRGIRALDVGPSMPPPRQPISPEYEPGVGWLVESDDEEQRAPRDRAGPSTAPPTQQRASMEDAPVTFRYSWESLMEQDQRQRRRTESSTDVAGPSRPSVVTSQPLDVPGPSRFPAAIGSLASYDRLLCRLQFFARHIMMYGSQEPHVYLRYLEGVQQLYLSGLHADVEERHWINAFTSLLPHTFAWRQHLVDPEYAELRAVGIEGWISSCRVFARIQTPGP